MRTMIFFLLALQASLAVAGAAPLAVTDFARAAQFVHVAISPDGTYLAATMPTQDHTSLAVIRMTDRKVTSVLRVGSHEHIAEFWWKGSNRVVASLATQDGSVETPQLTGELVAIDADGSNYKYLYGYRGDGRMGRVIDTLHYGSADMIDPLVDDPAYALIATYDWRNGRDGRALIQKINVKSGAITNVGLAPLPGPTEFLADRAGNVRYAVGHSADGYKVQTFHRRPGSTDWVQEDAAVGTIEPLAFSGDGTRVFLRSFSAAAPACLVEQVVETGVRRQLACDPSSDLRRAVMSLDGSEVVAAVFEAGQPVITYLPDAHGDAALFKSVAAAFPGQMVIPVSATRDGSQAILQVYSDRNPGEFYLLDRATRKVTYLMSRRDWVDAEHMSEVRAIELKARDGTTLHGYLTLPRGLDSAKLPLVVNPHGGPFGIRDHWAWDADAQFMASRGYAVLQVNFRGSAGYGLKFKNDARRRWGSMMIDDIVDATRWVVNAGYADPARMCIYGGSYGGYAALMSAVREPEMFRCVVGYAGVYDLNLLKSQSDIAGSRIGRSYIDEYIGQTEKELADQSPLSYIDKLKAPILIIHGEADLRAPYSQAKALMKALDARHYPYEKLVKPTEGHGFYQEPNRVELYETLLAFLQKNIGAPPASGAAAP